jgi:thiol-disulfide isomerase/thioredoxin
MRKFLIIILGILSFSANATTGLTIKPGDIPPAYVGKTLSGNTVNLSSLRGDVVVISFWATWCRYCMQELPEWAGMQAVAAKHGLHMQVIGIDYREPDHVFYRATHVLAPRAPGLILTSDPYGKIGKLYGVSAVPVLVMLHSNGKVAYVHVGYDKKELDTILKELNILLNEQMAKQVANKQSS